MNYIRATLVFLMYLFMLVICYFVLSSPITAIFDAFGEGDFGEATDEVAEYLPNIRTGFNMFFAGLMALPITWFIFYVFHREPDWYYRRY